MRQQVVAQHIHESPIQRGSDVIELGDERVLEPVDEELAEEHREHRIERARHCADERKHIEARGKRPDDASVREAACAGYLDQVAQRDCSEHDRHLETLDDVGARQLEENLLLKALEHTSLDLDKLVGEEERKQLIIVAVYRHIKCHELIQHDKRVRKHVCESQRIVYGNSHIPLRAVLPPRQRVPREECIEHVLANAAQQPVGDLKHAEDDRQLDKVLATDAVVHLAGVG